MSAPDDNGKEGRPSGRVRHDAGGRAVWEWAMDSGRHAIESTSRLLKRLDLGGLALADDEKEKKKKEAREAGADPYGREDPPPPKAGRGFDPYDNRAPPKRGAARPAPRAAAPRITQPPRDAKKPGLLSRLLGRKY